MARVAWVTGAGGLIGSNIVRAAQQFGAGWEVRALTRDQLDLCDWRSVSRAFTSGPPELVIHCAALSQTPACEADPTLAWKINFEATRQLAWLAAGIQFIFFSSDLVFDGQGGNYQESASVGPLSVYGKTKAAAELEVLANPKHTVIRTSLNGGKSPTGDRAFNEQLRLAWSRGQKTRLFTDEFRSPIAASVTARAVWEIANRELSGLFHLAGAERLSRCQVGELLAARLPQAHPQIERASLKDYAGPPRAPDTSLDCSKLQKLLSFRIPGFSEWVESHGDELEPIPKGRIPVA